MGSPEGHVTSYRGPVLTVCGSLLLVVVSLLLYHSSFGLIMAPAFLYVLQVETRALTFKESAQSKVGSMDYVQHKPGGGDKKVGLTKHIVR